MKKTFNWKIFLILWVASILSTIVLLPYILELQAPILAMISLPVPLPALIAIQMVQSAVIFAIMVGLGLILANRVGLGLPILESWLNKEPIREKIRAILPLSIGLGVTGTVIIICLEIFYFQPAMLNELGASAAALNLQTSQPAAWKGFLASFYGGITEEILLRLLVMTFFVWLGRFLSKTADGSPTSSVYWIANIIASVLFGLGHLPTTALLIPITPLVITRAIVLNGVLGIVFGWLYWKHGLESAMISHFSADIVLHVLLAL